jgi:chromosome segregation ATPase
LALMVAPAIWRRAVLLTRKRIEASVPLTMNEIQADKDRMRAEFAMSTRRLEMSIKSFRDKASSQIIEINRNRDEMKRLASEREEKNRAISELEARGSELRADLRRREEELHKQAIRLADADKVLEQKALEIEKLGRLYDEASLTSSSRQVALVARESEFEKLSGDISNMRVQRKDTEKRVREVAAEARAAQDALKQERRRAAELDRKVERLLKTVADREDKLERREAEMARLREGQTTGTKRSSDLDARLVEVEAEKIGLEAELAEMHLQMTNLLNGATGGDIEKAMAKLNAEKDQLKDRLITMTRENKKLKGDVEQFERGKQDDWDEERHSSALLREQINDLAAEVVNMTAMLEGPDSPIRKILASDTGNSAPSNADRIVSLADRVKALQKAAAAK